MVMAETERKLRVEPSTTSLNRLQWLRQRRDTLQEKLALKNNELKNLCIDEAELTGILPPEIPLDPGESPPFFRRRVGTSFAYPQNLINKLKTNEAVKIDESTLELERQVQVSIAKAAYEIFNDTTKGKAVRRKNRLVYQQSQKRLKELEIRLNFIRQGYGRISRRPTLETSAGSWPLSYSVSGDETIPVSQTISKHKTKKPRPPLHSVSDKALNTQLLNYDKLLRARSLEDHHSPDLDHQNQRIDKNTEWISDDIQILTRNDLKNDVDIIHDLNDNADVYVLPKQHSSSLYSHEAHDDHSPYYIKYNTLQITEQTYPISLTQIKDNSSVQSNNTWSKEIQHNRHEICLPAHYNQRLQIKTNNHQHPRYQHYYRDDISPTINEITLISPSSGEKSIESSDQYNRTRHGYYIQEQYSPMTTIKMLKENPGLSLQERELMKEKMLKRNSHENMSMSKRQDIINSNDNWSANSNDHVFWACSDYSASRSDRFGSIDRRKYSTTNLINHNNKDLLMNATKSQVQGRIIKQNNTLADTLSSSTKYLSGKQTQGIHDRIELVPATRILLRTQSLGSVETWHSADKCNVNLGAMDANNDNLPSPTVGSIYRTKGPLENPDTRVSYRDNEKEWYETAIDTDYIKPNSLSQTLRNLEIPAESNNRISSNQLNSEMAFGLQNCNSPEKLITNGRTIIQAGKYQPYKEVTKPFEMSDFYKYSTKFRKKMESGGSQSSGNLTTNSTIHQSNKSDANVDRSVSGYDDRHMSPLQQRLSCQSYIVQRSSDTIKDCNKIHTCQTSSKDSTVV